MDIKKNFYGGPRGFSSFIEHDYAVLTLFNEIINQNDEVYILGDLMLEDNKHGLDFIKQLNGKLHIILGNHDSNTRIELYKELTNVVEVIYATIIKIGKQHYFLCHYPTYTANYDDKPYHNHLINLHGHTHSKDRFFNNNPFMYNVALDAHNCMPVSIEEINKDIHEKVNELYQIKIKGGEN